MLLIDKLVPLALVMLAPIVVNIFFLHLMLDSRQLPIAAILVLLEVFLAWQYRGAFAPLLGKG